MNQVIHSLFRRVSIADNAVATIANDLLMLVVVVATAVVIVGKDHMVVVGTVDLVAIAVSCHVERVRHR